MSHDNDETRLLAILKGVVDRVAAHLAWQHPVVAGQRSVVALHMELHAVAAATHELSQLRYSAPEVPAHAAPEAYVRQERDRLNLCLGYASAWTFTSDGPDSNIAE